MVPIPFPGAGVLHKKSRKIKVVPRKLVNIEEGDDLGITIAEGGYFFHDISDIFTPGLPAGFFTEDTATNTPSVIVSSWCWQNHDPLFPGLREEQEYSLRATTESCAEEDSKTS